MKGATGNVIRCTWAEGEMLVDRDAVVTEVPVALVYNGISHVVMMATPTDLEDLALGFSLSEGILQAPGELLDLEVLERAEGMELAMAISAGAFAALKERRRNLTGRTGCGLCGVESLEQAIPPAVAVSGEFQLTHRAVQRALVQLGRQQSLKQRTGGAHGAAWCSPDGAIELLREDVGRHNALDKLLGALAGGRPSRAGFVLVTSRASYEMVAKAARCGVAVLAAVSAPTSLAVQQAELSGLTLVGFAQPGRQVVYSRPERLVGDGAG
ncbi:MAG: formate dehydrogenase accessory sulfurtransferase FdhD [Halieaceae bacterium]|nr:formate dehydrogenase accessory sulfurtransferase FdhD [Halieaceae bacterium]MCP5165330.1 formate dehydrogenase accessory sulfurtransferase FdhD [Pseudomonadales bacterium]MCP5202542.1 formate dehydrogenase accessory sulfurtransferase FdhD [Pseudomonadales bacterium]